MKTTRWRRITQISAWALALGGLFFLLSFATRREEGIECKKIKVTMLDSESFVTKNDIIRMLNTQLTTMKKKLGSLDIGVLEGVVRSNPYVSHAELSVDLSGQMTVKLAQKHPLMVVTNLKGQRFLVDREGKKMPFFVADSTKFLNVSGAIKEDFSKVDTLSSPELKSAYIVGLYLDKYPERRKHCQSLKIDENQDLLLAMPNVPFSINLGDTSELDNKFEKLGLLFTTVLPKEGIDKYESISLKFANQMVCVRKDDEHIAEGSEAKKKEKISSGTHIVAKAKKVSGAKASDENEALPMKKASPVKPLTENKTALQKKTSGSKKSLNAAKKLSNQHSKSRENKTKENDTKIKNEAFLQNKQPNKN